MSLFLKKIRINRKERRNFVPRYGNPLHLINYDSPINFRNDSLWRRRFSHSFEQGRCQIAICEECGERMVAI